MGAAGGGYAQCGTSAGPEAAARFRAADQQQQRDRHQRDHHHDREVVEVADQRALPRDLGIEHGQAQGLSGDIIEGSVASAGLPGATVVAICAWAALGPR